MQHTPQSLEILAKANHLLIKAPKSELEAYIRVAQTFLKENAPVECRCY